MDNTNQEINPEGSPIVVDSTQDGVQRCRYDLFVKLYPNVTSHFPKNSRVWTHRGDKYTTIENEMLAKLVRHITWKKKQYILIELWDNTYGKDDMRRIILKMDDQRMIGPSRIMMYVDAGILKDVPIADFLR